MVVIYVGGVKGVGKSFALSKVFKHLSLDGAVYKRIKVSEIMFDLLRRDKIINNYDGLENLNSDIKRNVREKAFNQALQDCQHHHLIFDGHYGVSSQFGYEYGIPVDFIENIDYLILLCNSAQAIYFRKMQDLSKKRQIDINKIHLDLSVEYAFAKYYAELKECDLKIIKTDQQAIEELMGFIREVIK